MKLFSNFQQKILQLLTFICQLQLVKNGWLAPHMNAMQFHEIDIKALKDKQGIEYLIVDQEGTISPGDSHSLNDKDTMINLRKCVRDFGDNFAIMSSDSKFDGGVEYLEGAVSFVFI